MTRRERRAAARVQEKLARKHRKHTRLFYDGRDVVRAGGWPEWSPMVKLHGPGTRQARDANCDYWFGNSRYQVFISFKKGGNGWPPLAHVSIKVHDKRCHNDWRDQQRIKNELFGPEAEGLSLYPAESRLMDEANQFHIFVAHPCIKFPFGQQERFRYSQDELRELPEFQGVTEDQLPGQRDFEDHHHGEDCQPEGLVLWPSWALDQLEALGYKVRVKSAEPPCIGGTT